LKQNVEPEVQQALDERLERMEQLVSELLRDQPDLQKVKHLMTGLQLPWSDDAVERLTTVLMAVEVTPETRLI
jgi:hypothetical protein